MISRLRAMKPHELAAAAFRLREIGIVIALAAVVIFFGARATNFLTVENWQDIAKNVSIVLVVAVGETMVILTRNIDLSVGSIVGLSGYLVAATLKNYHGIPVEVVALIGIAIGLGLGIVNGLLVAVARIPAIIATLATLAIFRGIDAELTGGENITAYQLPDRFLQLAVEDPAGVPALAWIAIGVAIVGAADPSLGSVGERLLCDRLQPRRCSLRRHSGGPARDHGFRTLGRARRSRRLPVRRRASRRSTPAQRTASSSTVITAVVIGGVNVFGGSGTILGVVIGAVLVATISNGFTLLQTRRVLEDLLQRIRHRRGGDDRRTRHQTTPGSAEAATGRAARRSAHTGRGMTGIRDRRPRMLVRWETLLVVAIIGVGVWSATLSPFFLKSANLLDLVTPYVFIGLLAFGLTFVVIAGEIDISVVSTLAAPIVCFAQIFGAGVNVWLAALAALGIAAALGLVERAPDRCAQSAVARSHARHAGGVLGARVHRPLGRRSCERPRRASRTSGAAISPITSFPLRLSCCSGFAVVLGVLLHATRFGRYLFAIGSNREAAGLSGIPVIRVRVTVFVLSGLMAGFAGLVYVGFFGSARADAASGIELMDVVTAVVLGGVGIFGGRARCRACSSHSSLSPRFATECSLRTSLARPRTSSSAFCCSRRSSPETLCVQPNGGRRATKAAALGRR